MCARTDFRLYSTNAAAWLSKSSAVHRGGETIEDQPVSGSPWKNPTSSTRWSCPRSHGPVPKLCVNRQARVSRVSLCRRLPERT